MQTPHTHSEGGNTATGTNGTHNYCRNPNGMYDTIGCYTTSSTTRWELCDTLSSNLLLNQVLKYREGNDLIYVANAFSSFFINQK